MARPKKSTVDYFPHDTSHGSTMQVMESKWGNDGYAFWFKLLELLGSHDNHYIDCRKPAEWEFLTAKTRLDDDVAGSMLEMLVKLEAIDALLWNKHKVIFCPKFLVRIEDAYRKRKDSFPTIEKIYAALNTTTKEFMPEETPLNRVNDAGSTEREREREREDKIFSASGDAASFGIEYLETKKKRKLVGKRLESFQAFWEAFDYKKGRAEAADSWLDIPQLTMALVGQIVEAAKREAAARQGQILSGKTPKMAQGWLTGRRWEDEPPQSGKESGPVTTTADIERFQKAQAKYDAA